MVMANKLTHGGKKTANKLENQGSRLILFLVNSIKNITIVTCNHDLSNIQQ